MNQELNSASQWRIEFAKELVRYYTPQEHIKMIVLGGSPAENRSDSYSDLDIVLYWDKVNVPWLEEIPLKELRCRRELFRETVKDGAYLESYYFDSLKADLAHLTMNVWEELTDDVIKRYDTDPAKHETIGGFLTSVPLQDTNLFEQWKERLSVYPDELAHKVVKKYAVFYHRGVLQHQGLDRDDILFFYHGLCRMLKNLLGVLAGLNKVYLSPNEPRWTEFHLSRMPIRPEHAWERMKSVFEVDRSKAAEILEGLIDDVFDLVREHMPSVDVSTSRHRFNLTVKPTPSKPQLIKTDADS